MASLPIASKVVSVARSERKHKHRHRHEIIKRQPSVESKFKSKPSATTPSAQTVETSEEAIANLKPGMNSQFWGPPWWIFLHCLPHLLQLTFGDRVPLTALHVVWLLHYMLPCKICRLCFSHFLAEHDIFAVKTVRQLSDFLNDAHNRVNDRHNAEAHANHAGRTTKTGSGSETERYHKRHISNETSWKMYVGIADRIWADHLVDGLYFVLAHYPDEGLDQPKIQRLRQLYREFMAELVSILPPKHPLTIALQLKFGSKPPSETFWNDSQNLVVALFEIDVHLHRDKTKTLSQRLEILNRSMNAEQLARYRATYKR